MVEMPKFLPLVFGLNEKQINSILSKTGLK